MRSLLLGTWFIAFSSAAMAHHLDFSEKGGKVTFDASGHPSALKIHGTGGSPICKMQDEEQKVSGTCTFELSSLDTGIAMRNGHMKDKYLEVAKFPTATIVFEPFNLPADKDLGEGKDVPAKGKLTLHGVEKPVAMTVHLKHDGAKYVADSSFEIKLSDYGITIPSFAGITVADMVKVSVQTNATTK